MTPGFFENTLTWVVGVLTAVAAWFLKKLDHRISELEKFKVDKEDFNRTRSELRDSVISLHEKLDTLTRIMLERRQ
jgi:hypothetical protein